MASVPFWQQAPVYVAPGGGVVTGYSDDPIYSTATADPMTDRYVPAWQQAPSFFAPGGGRVTGYSDDPIYSASQVGEKTNRGGNPILEQQQQNAVAQTLSLGRANGKATGGGVAAALAGLNQPNGSIVDKSQVRLAQGPVGWDPVSGYGPMTTPNSALGAIQTAAVTPTASRFAFSGTNPANSYGMGYTSRLRPAAQRANVTYEAGGDRGLFGAQMSPGMAQILNTDPRYAAQRTRTLGPNAAPVNRTQQALAQVAAASQPQAAPRVAAPTQSTQAQESAFQWTDNTYLPSAIANNPRWSGR